MMICKECPSIADILAWNDGELLDRAINTYIQGHIETCPSCQELVDKINSENSLISSLLDEIAPMPDISTMVLKRIDKITPNINYLLSIISSLWITSISFAFIVLEPYFAIYLDQKLTIPFFIKLFSSLTTLALAVSQFANWLTNLLIAEKPVLPALTITLTVLFVNMYNKRRLTNV